MHQAKFPNQISSPLEKADQKPKRKKDRHCSPKRNEENLSRIRQMEPQMVRGSEEYESKSSLPAEKPEKKEKAKKEILDIPERDDRETP